MWKNVLKEYCCLVSRRFTLIFLCKWVLLFNQSTHDVSTTWRRGSQSRSCNAGICDRTSSSFNLISQGIVEVLKVCMWIVALLGINLTTGLVTSISCLNLSSCISNQKPTRLFFEIPNRWYYWIVDFDVVQKYIYHLQPSVCSSGIDMNI